MHLTLKISWKIVYKTKNLIQQIRTQKNKQVIYHQMNQVIYTVDVNSLGNFNQIKKMSLFEFVREILAERTYGLVLEIEIVEIKEFLVRKIAHLGRKYKGLSKIKLENLKNISW